MSTYWKLSGSLGVPKFSLRESHKSICRSCQLSADINSTRIFATMHSVASMEDVDEVFCGRGPSRAKTDSASPCSYFGTCQSANLSHLLQAQAAAEPRRAGPASGRDCKRMRPAWPHSTGASRTLHWAGFTRIPAAPLSIRRLGSRVPGGGPAEYSTCMLPSTMAVSHPPSFPRLPCSFSCLSEAS